MIQQDERVEKSQSQKVLIVRTRPKFHPRRQRKQSRSSSPKRGHPLNVCISPFPLPLLTARSQLAVRTIAFRSPHHILSSRLTIDVNALVPALEEVFQSSKNVQTRDFHVCCRHLLFRLLLPGYRPLKYPPDHISADHDHAVQAATST